MLRKVQNSILTLLFFALSYLNGGEVQAKPRLDEPFVCVNAASNASMPIRSLVHVSNDLLLLSQVCKADIDCPLYSRIAIKGKLSDTKKGLPRFDGERLILRPLKNSVREKSSFKYQIIFFGQKCTFRFATSIYLL